MKCSKLFVAVLIMGCLLSCKKNIDAPPPPPVEQTIRLKDIIYQGLPSPYYHFEYNDSGLITKSSFASGLRLYEVHYTSTRISEIRSVHAVNKDRLIYDYVNGKPAVIRCLDKDGILFRRAFLTYNTAGQLVKMEWEVRQNETDFITQRVVHFSYHPDGNLSELRDERRATNGRQEEALYIDRFEDYDDKINVDDFTLVHKSHEHLALLPGIKFQVNNPRTNSRTGTGTNYVINYNYTYDVLGRPMLKTGNAVFTNGTNQGQSFTTHASFSYYR